MSKSKIKVMGMKTFTDEYGNKVDMAMIEKNYDAMDKKRLEKSYYR